MHATLQNAKIRNANISDLKFIFDLMLLETVNGHFEKSLLTQAGNRGLQIDLNNILNTQFNSNGFRTFAFILEENNKSIGFAITPYDHTDNSFEIWLVAILPDYQNLKAGKKMIAELIEILAQVHFQHIGGRFSFKARCAPASKAMVHILITNGFIIEGTNKQGYQLLCYSR